ncbi:TlpA family protein disulfide reductase [Pedobacter sp. BS3]|nr:TlpA family protein disulfide reductase [Pedobacter sp. BS3]
MGLRNVLIILTCWLWLNPSTSQAQNIRLLTLNQLESRLAAGKDTTFIVNFWATWCVPCVAELPDFEKLQATYSGNKLKVLLVSLDFKSKVNSTVIPFIKKQHLRNEVYVLNETNQQEYIDRVDKSWSGALPATLMVNTTRNLRQFFEREFTYPELEQTYLSLK